ncbi:MAG: O-antigen ligase family protein [Candidatus Geothermincolia bacterium]
MTEAGSVASKGIFGFFSGPREARWVVPAAMAMLLTFGRRPMLPFEEIYTIPEMLMNWFLVFIAPVVAIAGNFPRMRIRNVHELLPLLFLSVWIFVNVVVNPREYWPSQTEMITIFLSVIIATQVTRHELRRVRHFVLLLAGVFSVYVLVFAMPTLIAIVSGMMTDRLGRNISPAILIIFPRVMYIMVVTSILSAVVEKTIWIRVYACATILLPLIIGITTGGRGPMIAFLTSALVLLYAFKKRPFLLAGLVAGAVTLGYNYIINYLPVLLQRRLDALDSGRIGLWEEILSTEKISLFGHGPTSVGMHNIFLEMLFNYGVIGFTAFLLFIGTSIYAGYRYYAKTKDVDSLWVMSLFVLQLTAQQFSLDVFYGGLWAALVLPLAYRGNAFRTSSRIVRTSGLQLSREIKATSR